MEEAETPKPAEPEPTEPVIASWTVELNCECPACGEYIDLLQGDDFWSGKGDMRAGETGTPRTTGMDAHCHKCGHAFTVDCEY